MAHDNIFIILGLSKKWKILSDSNSKDISKLTDKRPKLKYTFAQQSCLSALFFWSISDDECRKLQTRILIGMILVDWQVKGVGWEDGIADSGWNVGAAFFPIAVKL